MYLFRGSRRCICCTWCVCDRRIMLCCTVCCAVLCADCLQGTCDKQSLQGTTQTYGCTCNLGFSGIACSLFTCPNSCNFRGTCLDLNVCSCFPGYKGDACEIDCGCNGHGMCAADNTCIPDAGWKLGGPNGVEPDCSGYAPGAACIAPGECGCAPACQKGACFNGRCECWAGAFLQGSTLFSASQGCVFAVRPAKTNCCHLVHPCMSEYEGSNHHCRAVLGCAVLCCGLMHDMQATLALPVTRWCRQPWQTTRALLESRSGALPTGAPSGCSWTS
jgi:hypothetical protein